jgi:hypothetical protein
LTQRFEARADVFPGCTHATLRQFLVSEGETEGNEGRTVKLMPNLTQLLPLLRIPFRRKMPVLRVLRVEDGVEDLLTGVTGEVSFSKEGERVWKEKEKGDFVDALRDAKRRCFLVRGRRRRFHDCNDGG